MRQFARLLTRCTLGYSCRAVARQLGRVGFGVPGRRLTYSSILLLLYDGMRSCQCSSSTNDEGDSEGKASDSDSADNPFRYIGETSARKSEITRQVMLLFFHASGPTGQNGLTLTMV
jgi:hypothetical protein